MYPEDRVLIGVVRAKRDLAIARDAAWYRIPRTKLPRGVYHEYIGLFLSKGAFKADGGRVAYFARRGGVELARRRDLIPNQPAHARADDVYYKVTLRDLREKQPPIVNVSNHSFAFIHTTWDRFVRAETIRDLYSDADYFVDRIYHALKSPQVRVERFWEAGPTDDSYPVGAGLRLIAQNGKRFEASTEALPGLFFLDMAMGEDELLKQLKAEIAAIDGPVLGSLGSDRY